MDEDKVRELQAEADRAITKIAEALKELDSVSYQLEEAGATRLADASGEILTIISGAIDCDLGLEVAFDAGDAIDALLNRDPSTWA